MPSVGYGQRSTKWPWLATSWDDRPHTCEECGVIAHTRTKATRKESIHSPLKATWNWYAYRHHKCIHCGKIICRKCVENHGCEWKQWIKTPPANPAV